MLWEKIRITLPDKSVKCFPSGITGRELLHTIDNNLTEQVLAILVNDEVWDTTRAIHQDAVIQLLTWEDEAGKRTFWHSSAHLLAAALAALYPDIQFGVGPPTDHGFYYDVDFGQQDFNPTHFEKIETKMLALAQQKSPYQRIEISKRKAVEFFQRKGAVYKLELLEDLQDGQITFYQQGAFTDLCKGPHIPHTGFIKAVKLLNVSGAYWRGKAKNKQLTRIYGTAFPSQKELKVYISLLKEAQKNNHQQLGKELKLFTFSKKVGIGLPLWLPKGAMLRERLEQFLRDIQLKAGYQPVITPHIGHKSLYVTSGHEEKYGQDSFQPIQAPHGEEEFLLKPMNCPHHCEIYKHEPKSYKDLPIRLAEFGTVYRYEQHGELQGLARTRCFTQDDAHIFCRPDQVKSELKQVLDLVLYAFEVLGIQTYTVQLSLRDPAQAEKYIGSDVAWEKAEKAIQEAVTEKGLKTTTELGEAAFYGPKLDFMVKDAWGRSWQLGTVQLDYQLPERFDLTYIGIDHKKHRPILIHRAPLGSLERFIALLIEHTAGKFPLWLAPDQVAVLPISEKYASYADQVYQTLASQHIRGFVDHRDEKIGKKIRDTELLKVPYMLIVGEQEMLDNTVAIRKQGAGNQGRKKVEEFIHMMVQLLLREMPTKGIPDDKIALH